MRMRRIFFGLVLAIIIANADQGTKIGMKSFLADQPTGSFTVTSFFRLVEVHNRGVSFGLLNDPSTAPQIMIATSAVIVLALLWWLWKATRMLTIVGVGFVIGGACGNIVDRLTQGYVFDFLDFHIDGYAWPAFNLADSAICTGAFLLALDGWLGEREIKRVKVVKES